MEYILHPDSTYKRLVTREVKVGDLLLGNSYPIRVQTMTTTDTMDTDATVAQTIKCIEAGAELVRITAPSKKEAFNLQNIKDKLAGQGFHVPLVADIHFTPNAAEIAARIVQKVRINPGNYVDKKKFEFINYTDADYQEEIDRIRTRFTPLVKICQQEGTAMRIGTNHGSLSDRIMSRYGDTPMGMVESAMEFLRIARDENYHQIVLSMKSSNPQVMVQAYRLLVKIMDEEFGECYPLHLGVTEAGSGDDGRIKSALGIGTLLEEGLGDTIRVSLTEDPELEIPVCNDLVKRYPRINTSQASDKQMMDVYSQSNTNDPFSYTRRVTTAVRNIGGGQVPVVIADLRGLEKITPESLQCIGYTYNATTDKWTIADMAADYVHINNALLGFEVPGTLGVIVESGFWLQHAQKENYYPIFSSVEAAQTSKKHSSLNFIEVDAAQIAKGQKLDFETPSNTHVFCLSASLPQALPIMRAAFFSLQKNKVATPVCIMNQSQWKTQDEHLVHFGTECGALLLDGYGDGIGLRLSAEAYRSFPSSLISPTSFCNNTAFTILQSSRTRISKTEYISCPSCGRTLFDLQETTAKIRARTNHLKGIKIAIMGCIVNGPGEMADADFGYVGSGVGKITLYKGKEIVKRNIDSEIAVDELINLLKENDAWVDIF